MLAADRRSLQDFREPVRDNKVHFLGGQFGGGAPRFGGRASLGAFQHAQDKLAEQRLVADAQRMKVVFHLHVSRVPFLQRTPGDLAGNVRQDFQGWLH